LACPLEQAVRFTLACNRVNGAIFLLRTDTAGIDPVVTDIEIDFVALLLAGGPVLAGEPAVAILGLAGAVA
jgi:hypothetical protein